MRSILGLGIALLSAVSVAQRPLKVTILHTNDLHAHMEPTAIRGATFGGYSRHATLIKEIKKKEKNVMVLNAGDVFQGTLYFNFYEGLADLACLNEIGYQAQTLGNHEFDKGPKPLIEYAKRANFPLVACNLDLSAEPELAKWVKPYTIIEVDRQKVAVIGTILEDTPNISSPGPSVKFKPVFDSVQMTVDEVTKLGINKIIVMTHHGYDDDKRMAAKWKGVDLIIGGHSHTPLGTPNLEGWRASGGPYPTYVKNEAGEEIPIVQAWEWGKVMGKITLEFDAKGKIKKVPEATALVVDATIAPDPKIETLIDAFRKPIEAISNAKIGVSEQAITDRTIVGYFLADTYVAQAKAEGVAVDFGLMNSGGVRANLEAGDITYGMAAAIAPFNNGIVVVDITGAKLMELLQQGLDKGGLIPSADFTYEGVGGKPVSASLRGEPIVAEKTYKVAVNSFMADGGDSLFALKEGARVVLKASDLDAFQAFIKANSPLKPVTTPRFKK